MRMSCTCDEQASALGALLDAELVVGDSDCSPGAVAHDMEQAQQGVILVQSANVLRHPAVLLRLFEAVRRLV